MAKLKKLGTIGVVLVIFSTVSGFANPNIAYYKMGYAAIPWYILSAICFFIPFTFMIAEYGSSFKDSGGGMYTWMRESIGPLYGFIGTFMWYSSYVVYMMATSIKIWIPTSEFLFGADTTQNWSFLGLDSNKFIGILAMMFMVVVTFFATRGFNKISFVASVGGTAVLLINLSLYIISIIIFILNKGQIAQPIEDISSFVHSPNSEYQSVFSLIAFMTFALFAYGGVENMGSIVEKTKSISKFVKGVILATILISLCYALSIFCFGISSNWNVLSETDGVNMGNIVYVLMGNLGFEFGNALGLSTDISLILSSWFSRITALVMLMAYMGAFFVLIYSPLKSLLYGAPEGMWPKALVKNNKFNMPGKIMWVQTIFICILIAIISFGGQGAKSFYNILILLSNVAQTFPYFFIVAAFIKFRNNNEINHDFKIVKSKIFVYIMTFTVSLVILFANIFTIINPLLIGDEEALSQTIWMIAGPVLFLCIALLIYYNYKRRIKKLNK